MAGGVERRRGDEGEDLAGVRVERDDGARLGAELCGGEVLEPAVDGQRQVAGLRLPVEDVADEVPDRVRIGPADEQILEGALDPRRAVPMARVPDDVREGGVGVRPDTEAVHERRGRQRDAVGIEDRPAQERLAGRDDLGIVGPGRERMGLDDLPPGHAGRHDREREHQVQAQAAHVRRDHVAGASPTAERWLTDSSRPIMMKLARMLEPP